MWAMPKLMASMDMDPEMAKDMAETRKKMQGMQNMDFMGSYVVLCVQGATLHDVEMRTSADECRLSSMLAGETPADNKAITNPGATTSNGAAAATKRRKGR